MIPLASPSFELAAFFLQSQAIWSKDNRVGVPWQANEHSEYWLLWSIISWHGPSLCLLEAQVPLHLDESCRHEENPDGDGTGGFHPAVVNLM